MREYLLYDITYWVLEVQGDERRLTSREICRLAAHLLLCGWVRQGEGEAESADALEAIPTAAVQPVVEEETPSPTYQYEIVKHWDSHAYANFYVVMRGEAECFSDWNYKRCDQWIDEHVKEPDHAEFQALQDAGFRAVKKYRDARRKKHPTPDDSLRHSLGEPDPGTCEHCGGTGNAAAEDDIADELDALGHSGSITDNPPLTPTGQKELDRLYTQCAELHGQVESANGEWARMVNEAAAATNRAERYRELVTWERDRVQQKADRAVYEEAYRWTSVVECCDRFLAGFDEIDRITGAKK